MKKGKRHLTAALFIIAAVSASAFGFSKDSAEISGQKVVISIAGDIMLDRGVGKAIAKNGTAYPFEGVSELFSSDDVTVANLECALTEAGPAASKEYVFRSSPGTAAALKLAGFDVLALANNHTMDYLGRGLSDTMQALSDSGISYAGAGKSGEEIKPCIIKKYGVRIGVLSYCALSPEDCGGETGEIAFVREDKLDDMKKEVEKASAQCDFLIVYYHWGIEYRNDVLASQIEIAHAAVDSGASLVVGTHPHVLQGKEIYKGAPIYYSIGNFVFDRQIPYGTDEAVILSLTVGKNGITSTEELPVVIEDCRPRLADGERAEQIKTDLKLYSHRFEK